MKNNKALILTIAAIAMLLLTVGGATYAYFAGTTTLSNMEFNLSLPSVNSVFNCSGATVDLSISPDRMSQSVKGTEAGSTTSSLTASFLAGTSTSLSCTYDIAYKWNEESSIYTMPSSGMEFTYAISGPSAVDETQFASKSDAQNIALSNQSISNSSQSQSTTKTYNITIKYYNLTTDQSAQAGNNYIIDFYCTNVEC